ncbi:MAG: hypothetical protein ACRCX7_11425 [Cetobacterium sp.]|uniref:hypothetical protein n=1 Tax=Cetobacterium sp. TaxID=2071632 RepID=UPI003F38DB99
MTFKVGDKIRCIDSIGVSNMVTRGCIYEIRRVINGVSGVFINIVVDDNGNSCSHDFHSGRFELYKEEVKMGFKLGDKVWSTRKGWGVVDKTANSKSYPIKVSFINRGSISFTEDGKEVESDIHPTLFFEEIPIPETALVRPKWRANKNDSYYCVTSDGMTVGVIEYGRGIDDRRYEHENYFKTIEEARESKFYKVFHKEVK